MNLQITKITLLRIALVTLPILFMVGVNELSRSNNSFTVSIHGVQFKTINPNSIDKSKCTWYCYYNTRYCKQNHVKHIKPGFPLYNTIDNLYFGMIKGLMSTGSYATANIIFLVFLWPFLIYYFLFKIISLINILNKRNKHGAIS